MSFNLERPRDLEEALSLMSCADERKRVLAGGTDLIPRLRNRSMHPQTIIDLSLLKRELSFISLDEGTLRIGALTTHDDISSSDVIKNSVPVLAQACKVVGSPQIRNRGTVGGNIANASPVGDAATALLALEARLQLVSEGSARDVKLEEFLVGPGKTTLASNEIISEIIIPSCLISSKGSFKKLGNRNALIIAIASVATTVDCRGKCRIAFGALAPRPVRASALEKALNEERIRDWNRLRNSIWPSVKPISDVRASAEYRKQMAVNLAYMSLVELGVLEYDKDMARTVFFHGENGK